jgi:hypothetical protein
MATPIGWGLTASVSGKTLADQAAAPKTSVQSIRLGFLGDWPFRYGNLLFGVLDFLGFSRANLAFSMGYAGFSLEVFSSRFFPIERRRDGSMRSRPC